MNLDEFFSHAWERYLKNTPAVKAITELLEKAGEVVVNDHIALRTFEGERVGALKIASFFTERGYSEKGEYDFPAKKVRAWHFEKEGYPKVFISELKTSEFSTEIAGDINNLVAQIPEAWGVEDLFTKRRPWDVSTKLYLKLAAESEYASWLAAWGFEPNHFTVLVNELKIYKDLPSLNQFLKSHGFILNNSGGEIKGSPEVFLEQSSIMAERSMVEFSDGQLEIPSCYYEFAFRYPLDTGELYEGFVAASADKIFESTNELGK